jgi:hypothetical protein
MTLTAPAADHRSWAWLIAAVAAYVIFLFFTPLIRKIRNPSPPPAIEGVRRTKVQAKTGVTDDEPTEPAEIGWWGRIVEQGGVRFRQAQEIMATGGIAEPAEDDGEHVDGQAAHQRGRRDAPGSLTRDTKKTPPTRRSGASLCCIPGCHTEALGRIAARHQ